MNFFSGGRQGHALGDRVHHSRQSEGQKKFSEIVQRIRRPLAPQLTDAAVEFEETSRNYHYIWYAAG